MLLDVLPGKPIKISGIPSRIVEDHHHVFPFWSHSKIKFSTLVHIDAHKDMSEKPPFGSFYPDNPIILSKINLFGKRYFQFLHNRLNIGNFIDAAIHYKIIDECFWINPFYDDERFITYYGNRSFKNKKGSLKTKRVLNMFSILNDVLFVNYNELSLTKEEIYFKNNEKILDIDLDAFATKIIDPEYKKLNRCDEISMGWEGKVTKIEKLIKNFPRPDIISISRSQKTIEYVPKEIVDDIQKRVIKGLEGIF